MTKTKGLASNFSPADLANKLKGKLNDLLMKSPKLANGLKTAGGMATGFMQSLLIDEAMDYGLEQLSQYVDSDTITKAMILMNMLSGNSKKNKNQGITENNKSSGDKDKSKKDKDSGNKDKEKPKDKDKTKEKEKTKTKDDPNKPKPKDQEADKSKGKTGDDSKDSSTSDSKKDKDGTGGTGKTEQDYRKLIDEAETRGDSKAANDLRYERYCVRKEASGDVPRSREDWDIANERLKNNSSRGSEEEKQGRESLANHLGRELEDNNTDKIVTFTSSEGHVTRPDSIGRNENKEIDIVHDHKHHTGEGNQVIYNDSQMRAEKEMAERVENGRHIVTMSSDNPDLYGVPPKPRPSAPLASGSEIYYTDPSSRKVTHKWVIDKETGEGFWEDV
ncbi:hypothetical protein [Paenibacillus sp. JJ-100]|uniref:hypothetical protein n=1 Tax=Paenibacillus sp. JJ-100 TaxID=2974896 RepID=UPI00233140B8|nr:hypothetical protein [Paenibacillus sp. JJ-100]